MTKFVGAFANWRTVFAQPWLVLLLFFFSISKSHCVLELYFLPLEPLISLLPCSLQA